MLTSYIFMEIQDFDRSRNQEFMRPEFKEWKAENPQLWIAAQTLWIFLVSYMYICIYMCIRMYSCTYLNLNIYHGCKSNLCDCERCTDANRIYSFKSNLLKSKCLWAGVCVCVCGVCVCPRAGKMHYRHALLIVGSRS